ncbi:MAG: hypothetical protein RSE23_01755 [Clostridia bacterium]
MNAVEIMRRLRQADGDLADIQGDIDRYMDIATNASPQLGDKGYGHGGGEKDKTAAYAVELARLKEALTRRAQEQEAEKAAVCKLIGMLPPTVRGVLHHYYVMGETLAEASQRLRYSYGYTRKIKADGMRMAAEIDEGEAAALLPGWYVERADEGTD